MPRYVSIAAAVHTTLRRAFLTATPREFVGLLGGVRTTDSLGVTHFEPLPNAAIDTDSFTVDAVHFAAGEATLRHRGCTWLGFVHSHAHGSAQPSARDRTQLWRDCLQLIVGSGGPNGRGIDVRAFWFFASHYATLPIASVANEVRT